MLRLTKDEQEQLRQKSIEINKILVKNNKQPLRDSELMHKIIKMALKSTRWTKDGEVYLEE